MSAVITDGASLEHITTLASMRIRVTQAARTAPVVLISTAAVFFALRDRVELPRFEIWALLMTAATVLRTVVCQLLGPRLANASLPQLRHFERLLFTTAVINAIAIGASFWLVAATGDITVQLVITLISCFYGIGTLVNASSHFSSFIVVSSINLGQGVLFWLGLGQAVAHIEVAIPFLAVSVLVVTFGRENARQFRESLRIRTENVELLKRLEADKKLVERSLEDARNASESKSRFLAAASHDLRQPLHALTLFLGTLSFHVSTSDAKRLLHRIKDTTLVLQDQFNSLLDLSKFDVGAVSPEVAPFRLDKLIQHVIGEMQPDAAAKRLGLTATIDPFVCNSDRILIGRVLRNLINNAVKYTVAGSIAVTAAREDGGIWIEVIDTGPGIPEDQQSRIFEEYVQLSNPARQRHRGMGLGLAIVKRIESLLGLKMSLKSSIGLGSRFRFCIPEVAGAQLIATEEQDVLESVQFRTNATVWILDDDPDVIEALREQLLVWGATVEAFQQPSDLLDALRSGNALPHWILTDDMLGSALSGLETAQVLSREFGFCKVCLITGNTDPIRLAELRSSGFPVLVKPTQPESLGAILNSESINPH